MSQSSNETADGTLARIAQLSIRGLGHSERLIAKELKAQGIDPLQVKRIYSELEPCNLPGAYRGPFIKQTFPNAKVTWSFEYGDTRASRQLGVQALKDAVSQIGK